MECTDDYTHKSPQVMYFPQSIPTKEVEEVIEPSNVFCNCKELCTENLNCTCLQLSGTYYLATDLTDLENYKLKYKNSDMPTYECNEQCRCKNLLCGNKLVQCGPRKFLKVKMCENPRKGEGLFTENPIKSGNFVCEYAGEIISHKEASARYKRNAELERMNYIFCIDEHFGAKIIRTFIDPSVYGNIGRYVNHSCQPNCTMVVTRIHSNIPCLGLFACRDIKAAEELSYDYGTALGDQNIGPIGEGSNRTKCLCGSEMCRGFLPYDKRII